MLSIANLEDGSPQRMPDQQGTDVPLYGMRSRFLLDGKCRHPTKQEGEKLMSYVVDVSDVKRNLDICADTMPVETTAGVIRQLLRAESEEAEIKMRRALMAIRKSDPDNVWLNAVCTQALE